MKHAFSITRALLRMLAPDGQADDVVGDLEEAHRGRLRRHSRVVASALTAAETIEMAAALVRARIALSGTNGGDSMLQDYKLGVRMLVKFPGLTIAGGLALAIAIGIGAGWYDLSRDLIRPTIPLPEGDRIVEIEMRNPMIAGDEHRLLHDFANWRRDLQTVEDLGAWRTIERNLTLGDAPPEPVSVAEITASAFRLVRVPPMMGRPLLEADEQPGAPPVVVIGHTLWQRRFGGRADAIGRTVQLGRTATTVVGVMPEGFAFPINHGLWIPLQMKASGYAPLEGPEIRVFARVKPGAAQAQTYAEVVGLTDRERALSPEAYRHLRPRVLAWGGESPGDRALLEVAVKHLPVLLVLLVACANVGTLIYARTATRDGEISLRYALGASRGRIISQLFVEALVLASVAAAVGLAAANWALKLGFAAFYSGRTETLPFWIDPGLKPTTMIYAAALTIVGAAFLGVLPAIKATGTRVQGQLRNLGSGGSTLRFGWVWTTAMILQVALTVICIPPARGIATEAMRDRQIREQFPAGQYLAVQIQLDPDSTSADASQEPASAFADRLALAYGELERRIAQEPGVVAVTFGDRLPGMGPDVSRGEVEVVPGRAPTLIPNLWTTSVGPRFFETFDVPLVAGRDFHDGDRAPGSRTVLVNEAFARRYMNGASPIGRRVRYAVADSSEAEPWLEIVGMVRDVGMTPTDLGEAPYVFRAVSPATSHPLVMGVRVSGDPAALAPRVRAIAGGLDAGLRLEEMRPLDELAWRVDVPAMVGAGAFAAIVALGLFLSAAGIYSLMSVSVARRTREIGLRQALGATPARLLVSILARAIALIGTGIAAGNAVLILIVALGPEVDLADIGPALVMTSMVMLVVGLLACVEPVRRALRIHPTDALKEV